ASKSSILTPTASTAPMMSIRSDSPNCSNKKASSSSNGPIVFKASSPKARSTSASRSPANPPGPSRSRQRQIFKLKRHFHLPRLQRQLPDQLRRLSGWRVAARAAFREGQRVLDLQGIARRRERAARQRAAGI